MTTLRVGISELLALLQPKSETLAYALFLATNATSIWGGVFPFLPLNFQTQNLMFWFFFAQATCFFLSFLAAAVATFKRPEIIRHSFIILSCIPYFIGWCFLIAAIYMPANALPLAIAGGAFLGLGSAAFYIQWQRLFVLQNTEQGTRNLILGTIYAAVIYGCLYTLPKAVTSYLIPLVFLPLMALSITLSMRKVRNNPLQFDKPQEHPLVYKRVWSIFWRTTLCMASLGFCSGLMRAVAIHEAAFGESVNLLSMGALFIAALSLLLYQQKGNVHINLMGLFHLLFPVIVTAFALLVFMPNGYHGWLAAGFYGLYSVSILLLMIQAGQASRDFGVNPIFIFGLMGGIIFFFHDAGFIMGSTINLLLGSEQISVPSIGLIAVWFMACIYFATNGKISDAVADAFSDSSIELIKCPAMQYIADATFNELEDEDATAPLPVVQSATTENAEPNTDDFIHTQLIKIKERFGLSTRELEVAEQLVRGKTVARIAEDLYVSENTIRTHSKHIYAKLNIHKKLELVDLVESI